MLSTVVFLAVGIVAICVAVDLWRSEKFTASRARKREAQEQRLKREALRNFGLDLERWYADAEGEMRLLYLLAEAKLDDLIRDVPRSTALPTISL